MYEEPKQKPKGSRGAPRKHGPSFKLNSAHRTANRRETFQLGEQTVRVQAWQKLHFKKLAAFVGTLVQIEFLKADGTPCYKRPMWLWWTGPQSVALSDLCRMYLWRFAIEHLFRFLKQHMGLNSNRSPNLVSAQQWMWLCALAYWQLLLMRDQVKENCPAWYPQRADDLTPLRLIRYNVRLLHFCWSWAHRPRLSDPPEKVRATHELSSGSAPLLSSDFQ